jgi:ribosomal-protein-serine acetyltransferase
VLSFQIDDRRCLRPFEEADADELYRLVSDNREFLAQWMPWAAGQTLRGTVEFIRSSCRQFADSHGCQAAIVIDGNIMGTIGFHRLDWDNRSTSIGYWIAESAQGHGTVTEAVRALTGYAFQAWKMKRIEIRAAVDNQRSRAIPLRLGFKEEGAIPRAERVGDRFVDHVVYAMHAEHWPPATSVDERG